MSAQKRATESVWDYPRPPRIESDERWVVVESQGERLAESTRSARVLETSHPPVFYLPPTSVDMSRLVQSEHHSFCEFKGEARYWDLMSPREVTSVAWSYPDPTPGYESIRDWIAFYPNKVTCHVDGEIVKAQEGSFYGGWITSDITGPFKGGPGTRGW